VALNVLTAIAVGITAMDMATRSDESAIKSYTGWNNLSANFATFYEFSLFSILPRMGGDNRN
jgi:hypothetical protein